MHDPLYDSMIYTVDGSVEGTEDGKLGVVDNLITYQLEIYPSLAFETQYVTNALAIYTRSQVGSSAVEEFLKWQEISWPQ